MTDSTRVALAGHFGVERLHVHLDCIMHMPRLRRVGWTLFVLAAVASACERGVMGGAGEPPVEDDSVVDSAIAGGSRAGNIFDPETLSRGDTVAGMVVTGLELDRDLEGRLVGTVRFEGEVTLEGRYHPHFDYPEVRSLCFEVNDSFTTRLPRFANDERRVWFCFENEQDAARMLGPAGSSGDATIVIDRYATVRMQTDAVDAARLVRVLARAPEGSGGPPPPEAAPR